MIIDKQETNTNVKVEGEITQLKPTGDSRIRYEHGVSNDKASIHRRQNSSKNYRIQELMKIGIEKKKTKREDNINNRHIQKRAIGDRIRITNKITVNHNKHSDLDKYATVIKITTAKYSKHTGYETRNENRRTER